MGFEIITSMVGKGLGDIARVDGKGDVEGVGKLGRKRDEL